MAMGTSPFSRVFFPPRPRPTMSLKRGFHAILAAFSPLSRRACVARLANNEMLPCFGVPTKVSFLPPLSPSLLHYIYHYPR